MMTAIEMNCSWRRAAQFGIFALALGGFAAFAGTAHAGSVSDWVQANHASSRLVIDVAEWKGNKSAIVAGIHVKLDDGWKTYWRNPGDAGLPPNFDWSGSENLKRAQVLWPAPIRFHDSAGTSYGYKKEVIFPVVIEPLDRAKPVSLKLRMEYAVCADICIPVEASMKIASGKNGLFSRSYSKIIQKYLSRVPARIEAGTKTGIGVTNAKAKLTGQNPVLIFDARFPSDGTETDLFVEGPEGYYLPPTKRLAKQKDGSIRYQIDLTKGDDPKDLEGQSVTLTLVSDKEQAEISWRVK